MSDLNVVILQGRLTRDPEHRTTSGGTDLTQFSLAVNRTYTSNDERQEETNFIDVTAWGRTGEFVRNYFVKGKPMNLRGRLKFDQWEAEDGTKRSKLSVVADEIGFVASDPTRNGGGGGDDETDLEDAPF